MTQRPTRREHDFFNLGATAIGTGRQATARPGARRPTDECGLVRGCP